MVLVTGLIVWFFLFLLVLWSMWRMPRPEWVKTGPWFDAATGQLVRRKPPGTLRSTVANLWYDTLAVCFIGLILAFIVYTGWPIVLWLVGLESLP